MADSPQSERHSDTATLRAEASAARTPARIAVFASGEGSNLQVLLDYKKACPTWPVEVVLAVSDKPFSRAVSRAKEAGIPVFSAEPKAFASRRDYEQAILTVLQQQHVDGIALAGYMRIVGDVLLRSYGGRIVNLHPSLLPAFPGKSAIKDALVAGVSETGVTVHYIDEGVDTGPVIAQWRIPVPEGISVDEFTEQVHQIEHQLYPVVIGQVAGAWRTSASD